MDPTYRVSSQFTKFTIFEDFLRNYVAILTGVTGMQFTILLANKMVLLRAQKILKVISIFK